MARKLSKDLEYERLVKNIYTNLLVTQGIEHISVQHNIDIAGKSGQLHQIDVYWEYRIADIIHKVAIECKHHNRTLNVGKVRDFRSVLEDIPNLQGIMVTLKGYQSGAMLFAQHHGIGLRIIRRAENDDYSGRVRTIQVNVNLVTAEIKNVFVQANQDWLHTNFEILPSSSQISFSGPGNTIFVLNADDNSRVTFDDLYNQLPKSLIEKADPDLVKQHVYKWENAFLLSPNEPQIKIDFVAFEYIVHSTTQRMIVGGEHIVHTIVKDAISGDLLFIDEEGQISGDREQILGFE